MIVHELKTWPSYFRPIWDGEKTFEIRFDDRGFQRGDMVNLREWERATTCECHSSHHLDDCAKFTGRRVLAEIGYVTASTSPRGQQRGFEGRGYVVFSLINAERITEDLDALRRVDEARRDEPADAMSWSAPSPASMPARVPPQRDP